MLKKMNLTLLAALFITTGATLSIAAQGTVASIDKAPAATSVASADTDRTRDGLMGPVRRVRTDVVKLSNKGGKLTEGARALLEASAYDLKGAKTETAYYPVSGATLTGKEVYKYDDKGNISEMTLLNTDGSLLSKETYAYEFDFAGNWTKMTTSVAVIEGGKLSFEPTEATYRTISYYLDQNMLKLAQAPAQSAANNANVATAATSNTPKAATINQSNAAASKTAVSLPSANVATLDKSGAPASLNMPTVTPVGANNADLAVAKPAVDEQPPPPPPVKLMPKPLMRPISGGILNGVALSLPAPSYPDVAKRARAGGIVAIEVVIDEQGKVISARAVSGSSLLQQAALQAARQARFAPTKLSGQPVKVSGVINYNFKLAE